MTTLKSRLRQQAGGGSIEYILIVAVVLAIGMSAFWGTFAGMLQESMDRAGFSFKVPGAKMKKPVITPAPNTRAPADAGWKIVGGGGGTPTSGGPIVIYSSNSESGR